MIYTKTSPYVIFAEMRKPDFKHKRLQLSELVCIYIYIYAHLHDLIPEVNAPKAGKQNKDKRQKRT